MKCDSSLLLCLRRGWTPLRGTARAGAGSPPTAQDPAACPPAVTGAALRRQTRARGARLSTEARDAMRETRRVLRRSALGATRGPRTGGVARACRARGGPRVLRLRLSAHSGHGASAFSRDPIPHLGGTPGPQAPGAPTSPDPRPPRPRHQA